MKTPSPIKTANHDAEWLSGNNECYLLIRGMSLKLEVWQQSTDDRCSHPVNKRTKGQTSLLQTAVAISRNLVPHTRLHDAEFVRRSQQFVNIPVQYFAVLFICLVFLHSSRLRKRLHDFCSIMNDDLSLTFVTRHVLAFSAFKSFLVPPCIVCGTLLPIEETMNKQMRAA